jgi:hypothetical protein
MSSPDSIGKPKPSIPDESKFIGTDNPRHLRALAVMLRRPISRQELDSVAGCANGPALVSDLRDRGLTIPCERIHFTDRDGEPCHPGVYSLTGSDRRKVHQWQATGHQSGRAS